MDNRVSLFESATVPSSKSRPSSSAKPKGVLLKAYNILGPWNVEDRRSRLDAHTRLQRSLVQNFT